MKILFIRNACLLASTSVFGNGVGIIATIAHDAGHDVRVIDNNTHYKYYTDKDFLKITRSYKPDVLAYSITIQNAYETYRQIPKFKSIFPDMPIIAGGIHMRQSFEEALRHGIDVVVNRDGEKVILPLLKHIEGGGGQYKQNLESVQGVSFIKEDGMFHFAREFPALENLDDVPVVNYQLFNITDYIKTNNEPGIFNITGQRGCPFGCNFCSDSIQRADKRIASADWLFKNVVNLYDKYKARYLIFCDNNFAINRVRVVEFCNRVIESGLNNEITFSCQTRIETIDEELVCLMKKAGFYRFNFGLERLVPYSLEKINKNTSIERVHKVFRLLTKHNLVPSVFILIGFPFENIELVRQEKKDFLGLVKYTNRLHSTILCPTPGTIYYDNTPKAKEWYLNGKDFLRSRAFFTSILETNTMQVLEKNFFDFGEDLKREIMDFYLTFKRINHGSVFNKKKPVIYLLLKLDLLAAKLSQLLFYFSPSLEFCIFKQVRAIRYYLGCYFLGRKVLKE